MTRCCFGTILLAASLAMTPGIMEAQNPSGTPFTDSFEGPQINSYWAVYDTAYLSLSSAQAHSGRQSVAMTIPAAPSGKTYAPELLHNFPTALSGTLSVWFYDSMYAPETGSNLWAGFAFGSDQWGGAINLMSGTADFYGALICTYNPYQCYGPNGLLSFGTSIPRTQGWHQFAVTSDAQGLTYSIDGRVVYRVSGLYPFTYAAPMVSIATAHSPILFYFDDFTWNPCTPTQLCILSPNDGASPRSDFVAITGTGAPRHKISVLVQGAASGRLVDVDAQGRWEALPYVGNFGPNVTLQVEDATTRDRSNLIEVHPAPPVSYQSPTDQPHAAQMVTGLRKADILISDSTSSPQHRLYGDTYSHAALYLGGDPEGTPLIAEAVTNGEADADTAHAPIRRIALEPSLIWSESRKLSGWRLASTITYEQRDRIVAWAEMVTAKDFPLTYWSVPRMSTDISEAYKWYLAHPSSSRTLNPYLRDLDRLKHSSGSFICSTLVWRAYLEGSGQQIDLSSPNLMSAQGFSLVNLLAFQKPFMAQLSEVFIVPETFARSPKLKQLF